MLKKRLVYPGVMTGAFLAYWALLRAGVPLGLAPYVALAIFGPLILAGERLLPYRPDWLPAARDFALDGVYMLLVQIVVPFALAWALYWLIQAVLRDAGLVWNIWPSNLPIWIQLLLKIVIGDFFRYWLHRAAHTYGPLWRLHAVHHAPEKLYTTNVFRFHPAEKVLQFLCDTLPFTLVGVGPEVIGAYFVFYSMSGLFQHSNCDVRLGWLNYLVSGPEVHRWHHSRKIEESNANYAHSFVVWDLIFGTYFRPADRDVSELGLLERHYPQGFLGQLLAPFRRERTNDTEASHGGG
ncbi:MAG: sterol desaturase family protein [Bauldia sp.]|nr:sterol desaturase family protein [Bauldia sp.]